MFLFLLSFLLLSACAEKEQQASVPEINVPKLEAPKLEVPKLEAPKLEVPKLEAPKLEVRKIEVPKFYVPKLNAPDLSVTSDNKQIKIRIPDTVLFDFDKSELKPSAKVVLNEIGEVLKKYEGAKIEINGHTDNIGEEAYNRSLSERRAKEVSNYLKENYEEENLRIRTKGYGESRPIAPNDTEENRQKNRRVEIVIEPKM